MNPSKFPSSVPSSADTAPLTRRRFVGLLTAGATTLAIQACGGGGGGAASAPPSTAGTGVVSPSQTPNDTVGQTPNDTAGQTTPPAPLWSAIPTLTFTQGKASSIPVGRYVTVASTAALALSLNAIALPPGVTFNSITKSFDYDGVGAVGSTDGHVLTAVAG